MKHLCKKDKGNVLATTAFAMAALIGFASWTIDVGHIITARTQLQNAVDAAALAGASGLLISSDEATNRAILFASRNRCINVPVQISANDISFPSTASIRVTATRPLGTFFLQAFGIRQVAITRSATAQLAKVISTTGMRPWCVPQYDWSVGDIVTLKEGDSPGNPASFYYPVDFPPLNRGNPSSGASA
jgi:Flp pilus assembly protein TadG